MPAPAGGADSIYSTAGLHLGAVGHMQTANLSIAAEAGLPAPSSRCFKVQCVQGRAEADSAARHHRCQMPA